MRHPENDCIAIAKSKDGEHFLFKCPGCNESHVIYPDTMKGAGARWKIHSINPLTISPSLLVRWEWGENYDKRRCHSFIKNNQIQFLSDCTHELAGKTVPLEVWDESD